MGRRSVPEIVPSAGSVGAALLRSGPAVRG